MSQPHASLDRFPGRLEPRSASRIVSENWPIAVIVVGLIASALWSAGLLYLGFMLLTWTVA